jgi:hypothetical protein
MNSDKEDLLHDFVIIDDITPQTALSLPEDHSLETICETVAADIAKDLVKDVIFEHKPKEEVLKDILHDVVEDILHQNASNHQSLPPTPNLTVSNPIYTVTNTVKPIARVSWVLMSQLPRAARLVWKALEIYHDIHSDVRKLFIFYFGLRLATGYFITPLSAFI